MELSFIIPAHNEEDHLPRTLGALRQAMATLTQPHELIVVDDDSTDRTAAIAAEHGARIVPVKLRQIAAVRNAGAAASSGRALIFLDADTVLPAATMHAAIAALNQETVAGGAYVNFDEPLGIGARSMLGLWNFMSRLHRWAAGCFLFTRADAFRGVGGFDERFYAAEEIVLSERLHRAGPFTILSQPVITSARKLHSHSITDQLVVMLKTVATGGRAIQQREGLELWYGPRHRSEGATEASR